MRLSIINPCYNMETYLPECVDSLLDQGLQADTYEFIIVNDGSKDYTLQIAHDYERKYIHVSELDKQNAGVGAARNSGFDRAKGRYVYFLDPNRPGWKTIGIIDNGLNMHFDTLLYLDKKNRPQEFVSSMLELNVN